MNSAQQRRADRAIEESYQDVDGLEQGERSDLEDNGFDCDEDEGRWCTTCNGTGIGQGDPDTSRCMRCHGLGVIRPEPDRDDYDPPDRDEYSPGDWGQPGDGNYL